MFYSKLKSYLDAGETVPFTVNGYCMSPWINDCDQILIRKKKRYFPGEILVYFCRHKRMFVVHRLLGTLFFKGGSFCLVKGDNINSPDALIKRSDILGYVTGIQISLLSRAKYCFVFAYHLARIVGKKMVTRIRRFFNV